MTADKLKVAIVGTGQIAGGFDQSKLADDGGIYTHANAYLRNSNFMLDCVFDVNFEKAMQFKNYWGARHCARAIDEIYTSYFDVVSVCTPDAAHYDIIKSLLLHKSCKTIFAEKPVATTLNHIAELESLSNQIGVHIIVNLQRRFDNLYTNLRSEIERDKGHLLTMNALYMKGLEHSGVAMIDTITCLCGYPKKVFAYGKTYNQEINEYSYDFILFYDNYNITVKAIDSVFHKYCYHVFEIDMLFSDKRIILNDNSRQCEIKEITNYAYSGINVLNDRRSKKTETEYKISILKAAEYIDAVTKGKMPHKVNTIQASYNNKLVIDKIHKSYETGQEIAMKEIEWKK